MLSALETLVEHSLVFVQRDSDGGVFYRLLEPVRHYAAEMLQRSGEEADARDQHAAYFISYAEQAAPQYQGQDGVIWLERTESESDNLRAALQWTLTSADGSSAARLAWALWQPWWHRSEFDEGRRAVEAVLQLPLPPIWRARVLVVHASLCDAQGDRSAARQSWATALDIARAEHDQAGEAYGLAGLAVLAMPTDPDLATVQLQEALRLAETVGEDWLTSLCNIWLGALTVAGGDPAAARPPLERAISAARSRGDRMVISVGLVNLAQAALLEDRVEEAESHLKEGLALTRGMGTQVNLGVILSLLAVAAGRRHDWPAAAALLGAAERIAETPGARIHDSYLHDQDALTDTRAAACSVMGEVAFDEAFASGRSVNVDDLVARLLQRSADQP